MTENQTIMQYHGKLRGFPQMTQSNPALTPGVKGAREPYSNMDYSDIHSVPFSKNTYTLQSVHTFFSLSFIIKNDTEHKHTYTI